MLAEEGVGAQRAGVEAGIDAFLQPSAQGLVEQLFGVFESVGPPAVAELCISDRAPLLGAELTVSSVARPGTTIRAALATAMDY